MVLAGFKNTSLKRRKKPLQKLLLIQTVTIVYLGGIF